MFNEFLMHLPSFPQCLLWLFENQSIYFNHVNSQLLLDLVTFLPTQLTSPSSSFFFLIPWLQFVMNAYSWMWGHPLEHDPLTRDHSPKENCPPTPRSCGLPAALPFLICLLIISTYIFLEIDGPKQLLNFLIIKIKVLCQICIDCSEGGDFVTFRYF